MCECVVRVCVRVHGEGMRDIWWCGFTMLHCTGQNAALRCDTKIEIAVMQHAPRC